MTKWGLATAKARLSEVVLKAIEEGPQEITKSGRPAVVVVSKEEWERRGAARPAESLVQFFRKSPAFGLKVDFERVDLKPRKVRF